MHYNMHFSKKLYSQRNALATLFFFIALLHINRYKGLLLVNSRGPVVTRGPRGTFEEESKLEAAAPKFVGGTPEICMFSRSGDSQPKGTRDDYA